MVIEANGIIYIFITEYKWNSISYYVYIFARYWIDRSGASAVDQKVQKLLFLFGATNSSFNPLVYGIFSIKRPPSSSPAPPSAVKVTTITRLRRPTFSMTGPEAAQKLDV